MPGSAAQSAPPPEPPALPAGWIDYTNEWAGARLAYPPGWRVVVTAGALSVRQDPAGLSAAALQPIHLQGPQPAREIARQWLNSLRPALPYLNAWEAPPDANTALQTPNGSDRCTLRVQTQLYGTDLTGAYMIVVQGEQGLISGFLAPTAQVNALTPTFQTILSSFRPAKPMPRQPVNEPSEGAFQVGCPQGWSAQPGLNRNNIGGSAIPFFSVRRDPAGLTAAVMPGNFWTFQLPSPMTWGMPSPYQPMPYQPAPQFCQNNLAAFMSQYNQNLHVEAVEDRPDLALRAALQGMKAGVDPRTMEITAAQMTTTYTEAGQRLRQVAQVAVTCPKSAGGIFAAAPGGLWMAFLDNYYRAPEGEFLAVEPVLQGILDSYQVNPAWQQRENSRNQAYMAAQQQDIRRRQQDISRTLSETSDIVNKGYWERQAVYDDLSHKWSNTILGTQDLTDHAGTVYNVPTGYDQYWKDDLGNIVGGGWLVNPDPGWTKLDPTGR